MEKVVRNNNNNNNTVLVFSAIRITIMIIMSSNGIGVEGVWCVARSGASDEVLEAGLNYACAAGADCTPLQQSGLCFLPNTLQAHASYAFNSFFQRNNMASGACDFSASATLAKTDPSYGSCVYPSSPSTAGSITSTGTTPTTNPFGTTPPYGISSPFGSTSSPLSPSTTSSGTIGGGSDTNPNMGPPIPTTSDSTTTSQKLPFGQTLLMESLIVLATALALF